MLGSGAKTSLVRARNVGLEMQNGWVKALRLETGAVTAGCLAYSNMSMILAQGACDCTSGADQLHQCKLSTMRVNTSH